jgi:hypothetical protein
VTSDERPRAEERPGEEAWRWQSPPSITVVENTLELADLDPLVRELQQTFVEVRITRRIAGPAAGGLFPDAALYFALGAATAGFLNELGKEVYRGLRAAFFAVYRRAKTWANARGYAPLSIEVTRGPDDVLLFIFPANLSADRFEEAILRLLDAYPAAESRPSPDMMTTWMQWDDNLGEWQSKSW